MSHFAPQSMLAAPASGKSLNATRRGVALGAVVFVTIATGAGALLAASLVRTAATLMRDGQNPPPGDLFESRVRVKGIDLSLDGGRIVAMSRLPLAQ